MSIRKVADTKEIWKTSFAGVIAAGWDPDDWQQVALGAGQAASQSASNGVITTGTTANAETIMRTRKGFRGNLDLRYKMLLSQRIANNQVFVELVDVLGDDFNFNATSATTLVITFPDGVTNPFYDTTYPARSTVGQSVSVGAFRSTATNVLAPGRYPIAAVTPTTVTLTVAGFTSGATGKCSLFGWNFFRVMYDGTVATTAQFDSARYGWASGNTAVTTNTSAAPGHMGIITVEDGNVAMQDQLVASSGALQATLRASRVENIPDFDRALFLQIRTVNGTVAPASTTTVTIGFAVVEEIRAESVTINGIRPQFQQSALPVQQVAPLPAGTANIGYVTPNIQPAAASGVQGLKHKLISAASTNGTNVKATPGRAISGIVTNTSAAVKYFKLYDKATAPVVGTDTPIFTIAIPANVALSIGGLFSEYGLSFTAGIGYGTTGAAADADATAVAAGDLVINLHYV